MTAQRRIYLGSIVVSDRNAIRASHTLVGRKLEYTNAAYRAREIYRAVQKRSEGQFVVHYHPIALNDNGRTNYGSERERSDPNTVQHEQVHQRADIRVSTNRWRTTAPLEESIAYAIADYGDHIRGRPKIGGVLRREYKLALNSARFMQCVVHGIRQGHLAVALGELYRRTTPKNRNMAIAFDYASDYLFFRECLHVLEYYGPAEGEIILFDALVMADKYSLRDAWEFLLEHLTHRKRRELKDEIQLPRRPIRIRSPYAPSCTFKYINLDLL